jgi:hypothetical protein
VFDGSIGEAIATPSARPACAAAALRPRRSRAKRLTSVNRSSRIGKRIDELKALFTEALGEDALTPMRREKIGEAAQLQAMAEAERGAWMRGEARCDLDELIRLERRAQQAVKALGIVEGSRSDTVPNRQAATLRDRLAQKYGSSP